MAGLRGRLKRLEDDAQGENTTLSCPECGAEFVVYGDAPLQYLCWSWEQGYEGETYRKTPADVLCLTQHEHDASFFVDEDGDPWLGEFFRGMGPTMREPLDNVEDLSEGG